MIGPNAMVTTGLAAMAAWVFAFLALRRPGKRVHAVWAMLVSSLILAGYAAVFMAMAAGT